MLAHRVNEKIDRIEKDGMNNESDNNNHSKLCDNKDGISNNDYNKLRFRCLTLIVIKKIANVNYNNVT